MQILKAGGLYFALIFGAGFVPGPIRILWLAPRFGMRIERLGFRRHEERKSNPIP